MKKLKPKFAAVLLVNLLFVLFANKADARLGQRKQQPRNGDTPPSIILIVADDLGYGDLGVYGSKTVATPNLDRMAGEGVRLTNFYVSAPVCTPSRAAILTGRYQVRSGMMNVMFPSSREGLDAREWTLADALRAQGYRTACIGKWHLGHLPPYLPTAHGFDYYYGIPYSNDMGTSDRKDYPLLPLMRNAEEIEKPVRQETLTARYTNEAIKFIADSKKSNKPFFLYLAHTMPHIPLAVSADFRGRSRGGLYGDVVEELDSSVGRILQTLDKLKLDRQTLVVFTSDNGPWLQKLPDAGSAGSLRDGKQSVYEGGLRVPFIARWRGHLPQNLSSDEPTIALDLFPTFLKLTRGQPRPDYAFDGIDIRRVLSGTAKPTVRTFYFYHNNQLQAVRAGNWKLLLPRTHRGQKKDVELYDLKSDPAEAHDIAVQHPEIVALLSKSAREFDAQARSNAPPVKR